MTEADVQADYNRKVVAARVGLTKALETRIANLKAERDQALELIREEGNLNAEPESHNEESGAAPQEGEEPQGSPEGSLEGEEGKGENEAEQEQEEGQAQE